MKSYLVFRQERKRPGESGGGGVKVKEGRALLLALVLASTTELSSHLAVAYFENVK